MKLHGSPMKKVSWYNQGLADGKEGFADAPMSPGHASYERYMEGNRDGARELEQARRDGDYYGSY